MATKKQAVVKNVSDFSVNIFDNGFTLQYSGNDADDNWADTKLIVSNVDELCELIRGVVVFPRN